MGLSLGGCRMVGKVVGPPKNPHPAPVEGGGLAPQAIVNAEALRQLGQLEEALLEFERAIAINPELSEAWLGAANVHKDLENYPEAETHYRRATALDPDSFEGWSGLGLVLQLRHRLPEAVRSYLRALAINPRDFGANLNLATAYRQLGEPAQALPYALRAVEIDSRSGPGRVNLGAVYAAVGEHEAAVTEFQQAAELMELTPELMMNLATSLGRAGKHAEAANTLDRLVRNNPSPAAYERLGATFFRMKRYDEALEKFLTAVELDPDYYPALNGIGVCLLNKYAKDKDNFDVRNEGLEALRRSLRIESNQPRIKELITRYSP